VAKYARKSKKNIFLTIGSLVLILGILLGLALLLPDSPQELPLPTLDVPPVTFPATTAPTTEASPLTPNPFSSSDFQYDGKYLTCTAAESYLGIDVSSHQGSIDWQQVADAGVEFVMIRAGFRGFSEGILYEDERAQENYQGAKAAGLRIGAYFFSQATSVEEALEEAEMFLQIIADWEIDMPLVFDWEYISSTARTADMKRRLLTDCTIAFNERIRQEGYESMIYFNPHLASNFLHLEELADYPFWLAMYTDWMNYEHRFHMWQFTNEGKVPGISTAVDLNLWIP
jgi:GH25 family lysozyme M1 (1,4-beta-N-acetylmuramidase)